MGSIENWVMFDRVEGVTVVEDFWMVEAQACGHARLLINLVLRPYSIGSLAKGPVEDGVENVVVQNVVFTGTQNGLRIKAWGRPSTGYVKGVVFK
ncbi:Pectin lyase-like superfamily protein [Thalictrum thalictroides]|uniref:Pectin lyase-like superfamily protein n=1 Tax=Thalictrum thalictroides TaxID=46969 RepID=A0A7J6VTV7_THATH|nr:Pectin lyase-like superfamily protein [Thalictrum thalictroides]